MKERIAAEYRIDRFSRDLAVVWQSTNKLCVHYRRRLRPHHQPENNKNVLIFRPSLYNDDNDDDVEELDNTLKVVCSRVRCLYERFCIHVISRNTRTLFRRFVRFLRLRVESVSKSSRICPPLTSLFYHLAHSEFQAIHPSLPFESSKR